MIKKIESEKLLERKLDKQVRAAGGWTFKLLPFIINGLPDRIVLLDGRAYFAEIKTTGKRAEPKQVVIHKKLEKLGFYVAVIESSEQIDNFINTITT